MSDTKSKHKVALKTFNVGNQILMYGDLLTTQNVKHQSTIVTGKTEIIVWEAPDVTAWKDKTFLGYHRAVGQVGTENVGLFYPLVFCENRNIEISQKKKVFTF